MLRIENVRKHSLVDVSFDPDLVPVLVEVYRTGRVRPLERATAYAEVNGLALVEKHFLRKGAAVSSRVRQFFHA